MATGEQSCDAHRCFHERCHAAWHRVRAATCGASNVGKLVAGQDRADHSAHAHHVALHVVRVACGAGDGHAQRETCLRPAGDGVELFQSRFDYWRRSNWLIGGAWQLAGQFPSLWRVGYKYHADFQWRDEGVRTVLTLMGPAVIAASAVQVNVLINSGFAASLGNGPVSWLNIAFRLMQLPLGIFGVAIGTVTLPLVSKSAAVGNMDEFRAILARGIRLAFLLTIPSAIGLAMFASPIISVIYQHGRFNEQMTRETAGALEFYAVGLVSYAVLKVLTPAFYAIGKRNTPMIISFIAIGANLFLNWLFTFRLGWGHRGLAFSTSLVATITFLLLYALMRHHTRRLETRQLLIGLGKMCLAGAVLALVCWAANYWWLGAWAQLRFLPKLCELLIAIALGAAAFFGCAFLLRVKEVQDIVDLFRSRFRRVL